jgi:hypothetical protein
MPISLVVLNLRGCATSILPRPNLTREREDTIKTATTLPPPCACVGPKGTDGRPTR